MSDDLVAFLRARLDEDEQYAKNLIRPFGPRAVSGMVSLSERLLREVEAKRAIIGDDSDGAALYAVHEREFWPEGGPKFAERVLQQLAAVYSDHPGYRQQWQG